MGLALAQLPLQLDDAALATDTDEELLDVLDEPAVLDDEELEDGADAELDAVMSRGLEVP